MASKHDKAVRKLGIKYANQSNVKQVYTDHVSKYPDPVLRVGSGNHIPDLHIKFTNNREKIIEIDSGRSMSSTERKQHKSFEHSARVTSSRTYEHYFAHEV